MSLLRKKKLILLLDDDPSMQRLVKTILTREGFRVDTFLTGKQAIAAIGKSSYDTLLLDLMMPHEGGMTVIKYLREEQPALLRRVLLLTGSPQALLKLIEPEVAGVVPKPFAHADLIRAVRAIAEQE